MPTTPDRTTVVTLDTLQTRLKQPQWGDDLSLRGNCVHYEPAGYRVLFRGFGWLIDEYQARLSLLQETAVADNFVLPMTVPATGILQEPTTPPSDVYF